MILARLDDNSETAREAYANASGVIDAEAILPTLFRKDS